ncbi:MAG: threonine ammonia-lyase, biosynthetic, partial [Candidatus Margulisbacteria bacterium]|nr:threonine ammonia-lyase, biosynthetic [Candidatus Margulisiibacteriota bacterium]
DIFEDTRTIVEPAGALGVAGIKKYIAQKRIRNKNIIAINSGANINFDRLKHIAERTELGEKREAMFSVTIPETPGSFKTFCKIIGKRSITEFNYRYCDNSDAHVLVGIQLTGGLEEKKSVLQTLKKEGYPVLDLSENEMAKLHIRHTVGGRARGIKNEILYRFIFPERPGALRQFLSALGHWNISLFHYRNHGAAFGRALAGIQVPKEDHGRFQEFLDALGYDYVNETKNPSYQQFLKPLT